MLQKISSLVLLLGLFAACRGPQSKLENQKLVIFHAGSLSIPFRAIADSFKVLHPGITIEMEAAGSVTCVRKITDLNRSCDILALADARLIEDRMIPDYADWSVSFAGNEIGLVYRSDSRFAEVIQVNNWFEILAKEEVRYGRSDPNSDPCGYRAEMSLKLADLYYPGGVNYEAILSKDQRFIRPKASDLMALLETGSLDYIFEYQSVGIQHGFKFLPFPDSINLGNRELAAFYSQVQVEIAGNQPGSKVQIKGEPMVYGLTIPHQAVNPGLALEFIRFLMEPNGGMRLLKESGQKILNPEFSSNSSKIPALFGT